MKKVLDSFDSSDSVCILAAQEAFNMESIERSLIPLQTGFGFLPSEIEKLSSRGMLIHDSFAQMNFIWQKLGEVHEPVGRKVQENLDKIVSRNPGYDTLKQICDFLDEKTIDLPRSVPHELVKHFKYSASTSVHVERSFSTYKQILSDKRHRFVPKNLEQLLVVRGSLNVLW